jgi:ABC-type antimicrobial peptide transport system permease subunit
LENAQAVQIGFRPDHVLLLSIDPSLFGYSDAQSRVLLSQLQQRVSVLPGVQAASFADRLPMSLGANEAKIQVPGRQFARESNVNRVTYFAVAPTYFAALGMPLLRGREFADRDGPLTPVAIVNRSMAERFWPSQDVLGKTVLLSGKNYEIVGMVPDSKLRTFAEDDTPCIYLPILQTYSSMPVTMLIRTVADPAGMAAPVTQAVRALAGNIAVYQVESLSDHVGQALIFVRAGASLFSAFGLTALLLASIGVYGVMNYSISRRTREIGIRIALGAQLHDVRRMILTGRWE